MMVDHALVYLTRKTQHMCSHYVRQETVMMLKYCSDAKVSTTGETVKMLPGEF